MTIEYPSTPSDDDDIFGRLVKQNWEKEPDLRDTIDAGIRRLLDDAQSAEDAINRAGDVSDEKIQEVLLELNGDWDELGIRDEPLSISGKLRPSAHAIDAEVWDVVEQGGLPGLHTSADDARGKYVPASGFSARVEGFNVEKVPISERDSVYRVMLELMLDEDYNDEEVWFRAYPEEIEYIETYQPTREGIDAFVQKNFPEVYERIGTLPDHCQDPELIRNALDDFVVTIDLTRADTMMGHDEVLAMIEECITDRLGFDTATYDATVHGTIHGQRKDQTAATTMYDGTLEEVTIRRVRLFPIASQDKSASEKTYRPAVETRYWIPVAGGGRTPIIVPIDSLKGLIAKRPDASKYPFEEELMVYSDDFSEDVVYLDPGNTGEATVEPSAEQEDVTEQSEPDRLELVRVFEREVIEIHKKIAPYVDVTRLYPDEESLYAASAEIRELIVPFVEKWGTFMQTVRLEVMGAGLLIPDITAEVQKDTKDGSSRLEFKGNDDFLEADTFTTRRGSLASIYIDGGRLEDDTYAMRGAMTFRDHAPSPYIKLFDPHYNQPVLSTDTTRLFFVNLAESDIEYNSVELARAAKREHALDNIGPLVAEPHIRERISQQLRRLIDAFDNENRSEFTRYEHLEDLQDMSIAVAGDAEASQRVSMAIQEIIGTPREIRFGGDIITDIDEYAKVARVPATLHGVVSEHPWLKSSEPVLILSVPATEGAPRQYYLAPISSLEYFEY